MGFVLDFVYAVKSPVEVINNSDAYEPVEKAVSSRKADLAMRLTKKQVEDFQNELIVFEKKYIKTMKAANLLFLVGK